jgi:hypothetical protein
MDQRTKGGIDMSEMTTVEDFDVPVHDHELLVQSLSELPDRCAADVGELASRIGAKKLALIRWSRSDVRFARLVASKVCQ